MNYGIFTIDTEAHKGINPVNQYIWGNTYDGGSYGIDYIMDFCESYGAKGLFFVDIAEAWDYGDDTLKKIITHIKDRGHDLGVHIHPDHMADPKRKFLHQYDDEEQFKIISDCTKKFEELAEYAPVSFRAGKYSANRKTLDILNQLGYKYDFSEFYGQKWCGIKPPVTADLPCKYKNLIEIPVTSFRVIKLGKHRKYDKLDLEMVPFIFKQIVKRIAKHDNYVSSLFLHSFSFVTREDINKTKRNLRNIKKAKSSMRTFCDAGMKPISIKELECLIKDNSIILQDNPEETTIKVINPIMSYIFLIMTSVRIWKTNRNAKLFIALNVLIFVLILIIAICVI